MSLLCLKQGIFTTIQDLGRSGFRRFGINPTGVMDATAARLVNALLGNDDREAVLELHFPAGIYRFEKDAYFALGGADLDAELDGVKCRNWRVHRADTGSKLTFRSRINGNRAYLAIRGGFAVQRWLGSSSTNIAAHHGGIEGRDISKGDSIPFRCRNTKDSLKPLSIGLSIIPYYRSIPAVRIVAGAEFDSLTAESREQMLKRNFEITADSNRMGYRLKGEPLFQEPADEILSSAVSFGTIQLLPNGQLIILMADHQTTGGYPRIGHVVSRDLPLLAQLGPGDKVGFHLVTIEEAELLLEEFENEMQILKAGVRLANLQ